MPNDWATREQARNRERLLHLRFAPEEVEEISQLVTQFGHERPAGKAAQRRRFLTSAEPFPSQAASSPGPIRSAS
jgi:hypothetical protein